MFQLSRQRVAVFKHEKIKTVTRCIESSLKEKKQWIHIFSVLIMYHVVRMDTLSALLI
jgi:hypothetical protein